MADTVRRVYDAARSTESGKEAYFMYRLTMVMFVIVLICSHGCIPSAPPETPPDTAPAPELSAEGETATEVIDAPLPPQAPSAPDKLHVSVPLESNEVDSGGIPIPNVMLQPMEDTIGYRIISQFPVEGLSMDGALMFSEPNVWQLAGRFVSDTEDFVPNDPTMVVMGYVEAPDDAGVPVVPEGAEVMISFSAAMPAPDAPKAESPISIPFSLEINAPKSTRFIVLITPF